jgi:hypothetical protein
MHIRNHVRSIPCPVCKALAGHHCVKKNGGKRFASHQLRWDQYRATVNEKSPN